MNLDECVLYRMAYGLAADLAEAKLDRLPGRHVANRAAGGTAETILAEVLRQLRVDDQAGRELVREGVEDALAGRRPQW